MNTSRKWSFRIQVFTNAFVAIINFAAAYRPMRDGNTLIGGMSLLMAVACTITAWAVVKLEERHRVEQLTRESYLREQNADSELKELMTAHFKELRAAGQTIEFGMGVVGPSRRHH